jgi:hypothetical protein
LSTQVVFTLRGRSPDALTCIANLSSDEGLTPPEFADQADAGLFKVGQSRRDVKQHGSEPGGESKEARS